MAKKQHDLKFRDTLIAYTRAVTNAVQYSGLKGVTQKQVDALAHYLRAQRQGYARQFSKVHHNVARSARNTLAKLNKRRATVNKWVAHERNRQLHQLMKAYTMSDHMTGILLNYMAKGESALDGENESYKRYIRGFLDEAMRAGFTDKDIRDFIKTGENYDSFFEISEQFTRMKQIQRINNRGEKIYKIRKSK